MVAAGGGGSLVLVGGVAVSEIFDEPHKEQVSEVGLAPPAQQSSLHGYADLHSLIF